MDIVENAVSVVPIAGTRRSVRLRWMKPYTMERITRVWIERDLASASVENGSEVLKDLVKEPYFAFKEAALMILNHDLKIRFFYWFYMVFSKDMNEAMRKMTKKEAEQYQAELLSAAKRLSSKTFQGMENLVGGGSDGSATSAIGAY